MKGHRFASPALPRLVILLLAGTAISGCALNPYVESPRPQEFNAPHAANPDRTLEAAPRNIREVRYARWYIGEIRVAMQNRHRVQFGARNALTAGVFGAAAGGAVAGLFGANRDILAGLAAGAATGVAASQLFFDRQVGAAYRTGMAALECLDAHARMQQAIFIASNRVSRDLGQLRYMANVQQGMGFTRAQTALQSALGAERQRPTNQRSAFDVVATLDLREADTTRRLIAAADAVRLSVNDEISRLEPDVVRAAAVGGQIAAATQAMALSNAQAGSELRQNFRNFQQSIRRSIQQSDSTATQDVPAQPERPESAGATPAPSAAAGQGGATNEAPTDTRTQQTNIAEVGQAFLINVDALIAALDDAQYSPPSCINVPVPISTSHGRMVTVPSGSEISVRLAGGAGAYEVLFLSPVPASLQVRLEGGQIKIKNTSAPRGTYVILIRDATGDSARRQQELTFMIVVP